MFFFGFGLWIAHAFLACELWPNCKLTKLFYRAAKFADKGKRFNLVEISFLDATFFVLKQDQNNGNLLSHLYMKLIIFR